MAVGNKLLLQWGRIAFDPEVRNGAIVLGEVNACTGRKWTAIPIESGHPFRLKVDRDSDGNPDGVRGWSESVSRLDWNGCPRWIGIGGGIVVDAAVIFANGV